jgi:hypothetical protein
MPKDFAGFEKRFGWRSTDAADFLLGNVQPIFAERGNENHAARAGLTFLAREYRTFFTHHPNATHLFPMTGAHFQFEFAKGVRDALGLKTRLRTIVVQRDPGSSRERESEQAKKLGLKGASVVMHDSVSRGITRQHIADAAGIPEEDITVHRLRVDQTIPFATVPLPGKKDQAFVVASASFAKHLPRNAMFVKSQSQLRVPTGSELSSKDRAFVRRAVYAAGFASARELMKIEKKA